MTISAKSFSILTTCLEEKMFKVYNIGTYREKSTTPGGHGFGGSNSFLAVFVESYPVIISAKLFLILTTCVLEHTIFKVFVIKIRHTPWWPCLLMDQIVAISVEIIFNSYH